MSNSVIGQVVEQVIQMAMTTEPFASITRGALPTGEGIVCEVGPTMPPDVYLDKNAYFPLDITFNAKHPNLQTLNDTLCNIHSYLTRLNVYPDSDGWQIVDITNETMPQIIGREENNEWLMSSSVIVKFYQKGD